MGFSFGLHVSHDYDLAAMMASPDMASIYATVLQVRWGWAWVVWLRERAASGLARGGKGGRVSGLVIPQCAAAFKQLMRFAWPLQACRKHGVAPGVFCLGQERAVALAALGYTRVAYQTDLGVLVQYATSSLTALKAGGAAFSI